MASSIEEIRELVDDPESDLAGLLSRAALLATALKQRQVATWIRHELSGYGEGDELPGYRQGACGTLVAWFPGQGWAEAPIERASVKDGLLCYAVYQPLPDVERAFNENSRTGGQRVDFTPERLAELQETTRLSTRLALAVPSQSFAMAVLGVREALRLWIDRLISLEAPRDAHKFSQTQCERAHPADEELPTLLGAATETARTAAATLKPRRKGLLGRLLGIG